jgi:hypothetical protein
MTTIDCGVYRVSESTVYHYAGYVVAFADGHTVPEALEVVCDEHARQDSLRNSRRGRLSGQP